MKVISRIATVDASKCTGCRSCENHCPTTAIKVKGNKEGGSASPCRNACPAGVNVPGYVALAGQGDYEGAYRLIRQNNPFPSVCGRICTHPCQAACNRGTYDAPVAIKDIKRFVADAVYAGDSVVREPVWPKNGKSVGIIGAGPSGLTCAYYLALSGFDVEVYEQQPVAGGVLLFGIPEYRLPKDILAQEIREIENVGVQIHLNTEVGKDITLEQLRAKHDSIYIATGTQFSKFANVPGETLPGVYHGLDFMKDVNLGRNPVVGKKAVVIGGGNTAVDVSRSLRRMGVEDVTILYRRRVQDMPADPVEIEEAIEEGVNIVSMVAPVEIVGDPSVNKVRCIRMEMSERDEKGRRGTRQIPGSEFDVEADSVVIAVSQYADFPFVNKDEVEMTKWGYLVTDEQAMTSMPGVFSGGDVVRGSETAISAIADGRKAAYGIAQYLGVKDLNVGAEIKLPDKKDYKWDHAGTAKMPTLPAAERVLNQDEVALGLTEQQIKDECNRCYRCTSIAQVDPRLCMDCQLCWEYCPHGAITMVPLEEERVMKMPPEDINNEERINAIIKMCHDAHMLPMFPICVCTLTWTWEVCAAILNGAHTMEEVTEATGVRTGCGGMYCFMKISRLLEAAGYPQTAREDGMWYNIPIDVWNISDENAALDPHLRIEKTRDVTWNEEEFAANVAMFKMSMAEARKSMEEATK